MSDYPYVLSSYIFWRKHSDSLDKTYGISFPCPAELWASLGKICPICDGANSFYSDDDVRYYCVCQLTRMLDNTRFQFESPIQPMRFADLKPFTHDGDVSADLAKAYAQGAIDLINIKKHLVQWLKAPNRWMFIEGGYGNGKTHIMSVIKYTLPKLALYISAEQLQRKFFASLRETEGLEPVIEMLSQAPILLIDDFGSEHLNDFTLSTLHKITNFRHMASPQNFPVVMTTNHSISAMATTPNAALGRTISRMIDSSYSDIFHLAQPDYRHDGTKAHMKVVK